MQEVDKAIIGFKRWREMERGRRRYRKGDERVREKERTIEYMRRIKQLQDARDGERWREMRGKSAKGRKRDGERQERENERNVREQDRERLIITFLVQSQNYNAN